MESFWDPLQALEFSVAARLPSFGFIPRRPRRPNRPSRPLRPRRSRRPRRHRRHFLWFPGHVLLHAPWCPLRGMAVGARPHRNVTRSHAAILAKGVTLGVEVSHRCRSLQWHG